VLAAIFFCPFYTWLALGQNERACMVTTSIACAKFTAAGRLDKEARHLTEKGFLPTDGDRVSVVDKDGSEEFRIELEAGSNYAFIAACGHDCSRVEIALFNEKQERLAVSTETQAVVILNGSIPTSGTHTVSVSAPGCNHVFLVSGSR
jgi:hypothetical protein